MMPELGEPVEYLPVRVQRRQLAWSVAAGLCLAAIYTVTPLTVCVVVAAVVILPWFGRGLPREERQWLTAVVVLALIVHLMAIGGLFLRNLPNHDDLFVGATSGDEAYTMSRALRTRAILRGSATSLYDFFVAFDDYGHNSYVTVATAIQVVFGPTPYSLRLFNTLLFTAGALLLFRLCRRAFGIAPALTGLAVVLFWPSLFAWSISLLKESLYFLLSAVIVAATIAGLRASRWRSRVLGFACAVTAAALVQGLRPGALPLAAAGLTTGFAAHGLFTSKRTFVVGTAIAAVFMVFAVSTPALSARLVQALEGTAKTHTGHVFTVGHDYKLLDAGFYVNPQTPAASTLTLTNDEAARYLLRAASSFVVVPAPWHLQSARELAYLPEQMAWYTLVLLLPVGIVAGYRRDRLVTCMLVGYVAPTAVALALTNGNVGTLLRLRGLVVPFLAWVSAAGFCAVIDTLGQKDTMAWIDEDGRLFGRVNLFDAAIAGMVVVLIPIAYGTFLLFRAPAPRISSVVRVPITQEERRVAGGNRLTAKLKIRGSGLRPMLQASIGGTRALGFVFENPNSADVMVGVVPAGTHDFILLDGVQEVARLPKSVTIEPMAPSRIAGLGTLVHLDKATADALAPGALSPGGTQGAIVKLGTVREEPEGRWQRPAEIVMPCDPDPNDEGCAIGGIPVAASPASTVKLTGPSGTLLSFTLAEVLPATPPAVVSARVRIAAAPEVLTMVRAGDRDDCLDDRAAVVVGTQRLTSGTGLDLTLRLGVDRSADGLRYRGRAIKPGVPFTLTTERYVLEGTVLEVDSGRESASK
jgi:hypothetical protein